MSDTTSRQPQSPRDRGKVVISIVAQCTFLVALFAASYLYWVTKDAVVLAVLGTMLGSTSTNASNVVSFWIGSSQGDDKKAELLAQSAPVAVQKP